jgi:hypothetical protein
MPQSKEEAKALLEAIGVCCELTGTQISEAAARVLANDLAEYPHQQVMGALATCRRELTGRLTLGAIVERLTDGRPGPQEAWAMLSQAYASEGVTVVWTDEMSAAFRVALACEDAIAARMAFLESYRSLCIAARREKLPCKWTPSLGHDRHGRDGPLLAAVTAGRITAEHAQPYLVGDTSQSDLRRLAPQRVKLLADKLAGHALPRPSRPPANAETDETGRVTACRKAQGTG